MAIAICEGPIVKVSKIFADNKLVYDINDPNAGLHRYTSINFHLGTETQAPDPIIVAAEGANRTPRFINLGYFVLERLLLAEFGNRIPQFSIEVEAQAAPITAAAVAAVMVQRSGIDPAVVDATGLSKTVRGIALTESQTVKEGLKLLLDAYRGRARLTNGVVQLFDIGLEDAENVTPTDLGASEPQQQSLTQLVKLTDASDDKLPREVQVTYNDIDKAFNTGSQRARRALDNGRARIEVSFPIVLNGSEAREYVEQKMWEAWNERQTFALTIPPEYVHLQETDTLEVQVEGSNFRVRVMRIIEGFNFLSEVEAVVQSVSIDQTVVPPFIIIVNPPVDPTNPSFQTLYSPPTLIVHLLDIAALEPSAVKQTSFLYGHTTTGVADQFLGVDYFRRFGTTVPFAFRFRDTLLSRFGSANTLLPAAPSALYWDMVNSVEVTLFRDDQTLSSAADRLEVLGGKNWALVGDEIIGFKQAALIGARTWRLSELVRGLRDTDDEMSTHIASERFIVLDDVVFRQLTFGDINSPRFMRMVPDGEDINNIADVPFTPSGKSLRPFAPTHITGTRNGGSDLTVAWIGRTRDLVRTLSLTPFPPLESSERYEVDVLNGVTVVRTIAITLPNTTTPGSIVYTAAQQVTDFGSVQSALSVRIYKLSDFVGRGRFGEATI